MSRGDTGLGIDFNFPWQEGLINNRGETVIHEIGMRCPCNIEDVDAGMIEHGAHVLRRRKSFNCEICGSEGYIYRQPRKIVALISSFSEQKTQTEDGWAYPGDVTMSVKPGYSVSAGDRITFTWEEEVPDGQVIVRGAANMNDNAARKTNIDTDEDRLWYHAIEAIHCEDLEGHVYKSNADFLLNGSKVIKWLGTGPPKGKPYVIKYKAYLEWIAFVPPYSRRDRDRDLGSRIALRKRHVAHINQDPTINVQDRVIFCDKLSSTDECSSC